MKKIFSFSQKKFLSFPVKKQHKKCAELLKAFAQTHHASLMPEYEKISSWMGLTQHFTFEERFHHHLLQANMITPEHEFLRKVCTGDKKTGSPWLSVHTYLDGLRSCHNVGSIVRSIEAFRLGPLHLSADMMPSHHPLIQKVSMGAWEEVSLHHATPLSALPRPWIALETVATAPSWNTFTYPKECTLFLGNEERGISPELLSQCESVVAIPLFGKKNSLNVANAFAILAAEVASQLHTQADTT